jgi:hypothetical protein
MISGTNDKITIFSGADSSEVRVNLHQAIKYAFPDVLPGSNKELVLLIEHYLMNTEIYTLEVYEIKTAD